MSYNSSCGCNDKSVYSSPINLHQSQCLTKDNYLSEFFTEVEKSRVRQNLGITDEFSLNWGNITGLIENQTDLIALIKQMILNAEIGTDQIDASELLVKLNNLIDEIDVIKELKADKSEVISFNRLIQSLQTSIDQLTNQLNFINGELANIKTKHNNDITNLRNLINSLHPNIPEQNNFILKLNVSDKTTDLSTGNYQDAAVFLNAIIVTADYGDYIEDVTDTCRVECNPNNIVYWKNHNLYYTGNVGTAVVTFTYKEISTNIIITTTNNYSSVVYIGYADDYNKILGKSTFQYNTAAGTWNSSNLKTSGSFPGLGLWIITPENITSITQNSFSYDLTKNVISYGGKSYNIYVIGPVDNNSGEFKITVA